MMSSVVMKVLLMVDERAVSMVALLVDEMA